MSPSATDQLLLALGDLLPLIHGQPSKWSREPDNKSSSRDTEVLEKPIIKVWKAFEKQKQLTRREESRRVSLETSIEKLETELAVQDSLKALCVDQDGRSPQLAGLC